MSLDMSSTIWSTSAPNYTSVENSTASHYEESPQAQDVHRPLYIEVLVGLIQGIIFLLGVFGNIMVILVVIRVKEMRTSTNFFLLNLSIADLLVLVVCQPVALMEFYAKDRWYLGEIICKLVPLMENGVCHVSIMTILAVTTERFYAICHPLKNRVTCSRATVIKIIVGIWITASACTSPFLVMTVLEDAEFYDGTPIKVCRTKIEHTWNRFFIVAIVVVFFGLPFFVLVYMYSRIIKTLISDALRILTKNDPRAMNTHRARKQVIKMLIFIIILFFVSLCPIRVVTLWLIFTDPKNVQSLGLEGYLALLSAAQIMMYMNSMGNPIIYSLTSTKFKQAFKEVLRGSNESRSRQLQLITRRSTCGANGYLLSNGSKLSVKKCLTASEEV